MSSICSRAPSKQSEVFSESAPVTATVFMDDPKGPVVDCRVRTVHPPQEPEVRVRTTVEGRCVPSPIWGGITT